MNVKDEKLYAYLQDDVTQKRPTVRLIIDFLCQSFAEEVAARAYFFRRPRCSAINCCTMRYARVSLRIVSSPLKVDERIVQFLLGSSQVDLFVSPLVSRCWNQSHGHRPDAGRTLAPEAADAHAELFGEKISGDGKLVFFLQGPCPLSDEPPPRLLASNWSAAPAG